MSHLKSNQTKFLQTEMTNTSLFMIDFYCFNNYLNYFLLFLLDRADSGKR